MIIGGLRAVKTSSGTNGTQYRTIVKARTSVQGAKILPLSAPSMDGFFVNPPFKTKVNSKVLPSVTLQRTLIYIYIYIYIYSHIHLVIGIINYVDLFAMVSANNNKYFKAVCEQL